MLKLIISDYNYWLVIIIMMTGLYTTLATSNLIKKLMGLSIFQTTIFFLYISKGKIIGGTAPILIDDPSAIYSNPLPHVLILTAIVVSVSTLAVGLALAVRINSFYGTIYDTEIRKKHDEAARQLTQTPDQSKT